MDHLEQTKKNRNLPFLKIGMRVYSVYSKKYGVITGGTSGCCIMVKLNGQNKSIIYHPCWMIKYFDDNDQLIKEFS